jgi:predicted glycosyl hydrolase (DUF1957 family)
MKRAKCILKTNKSTWLALAMLDGQIKCNFDPKLFGYWKQMGMQFLEQEVKGLVSASGAPRSNAKRKKMYDDAIKMEDMAQVDCTWSIEY